MATISSRLKHAWNTFSTPSGGHLSSENGHYGGASTYGGRPDRARLYFSHERSIITSIYNRIAIDVSAIDIRHVRLDDKGRYLEDINSGINNCLTVEANLDQAARAFRQDLAMTLCDKGVIALVPIDTTLNPELSSSYDILTVRVGEIITWFPKHVRVSVYNENTGQREEITLKKKNVAIVENPLYAVMNETNSTLQRIIRKLNMLDAVDEQSSSGKLDMIIQLPYVIKSDARREQAEKRREDLEGQLKGSKYGIAYTDGTEKITQLNRPAENNLWNQIQDLLEMLYGQLGITPEVMNGTADEKVMLNYNNRTIEPIVTAVTEAMTRTFLTKTARTQNQKFVAFRDPFKLVPIDNIAEIGDKFTRNEIMTSNEIRQVIGMKPSDDPKADKLQNSNMPQVGEEGYEEPVEGEETPVDDAENSSEEVDYTEGEEQLKIMEKVLDDLEKEIDSLIGDDLDDDSE